MQHVGSKFLNQGSKPHLHWKHRILTTGQPGKSLDFLFRLHLQGFLTLVCGSCLVAKSFPTLCGPLDCSPPGSSVHGISQARPLEWVVISLSRKSSLLRNRTCLSCIANGFFTTEPAYFFFPPEKEMAIHSSTLARKISWTEEPGALQFMGSQSLLNDWAQALEDLLEATDLFIPQKNTHMVIPSQIQLQGIYTKGSPDRILFPNAYEITTVWIFQLGNWRLVLIIRREFSCLLNSLPSS